jgi:hypothetical protein
LILHVTAQSHSGSRIAAKVNAFDQARRLGEHTSHQIQIKAEKSAAQHWHVE